MVQTRQLEVQTPPTVKAIQRRPRICSSLERPTNRKQNSIHLITKIISNSPINRHRSISDSKIAINHLLTISFCLKMGPSAAEINMSFSLGNSSKTCTFIGHNLLLVSEGNNRNVHCTLQQKYQSATISNRELALTVCPETVQYELQLILIYNKVYCELSFLMVSCLAIEDFYLLQEACISVATKHYLISNTTK